MKPSFKKGKITVVIFVLLFCMASILIFFTVSNQTTSVNSFETCVAAGNPVMESYPEQCAADGRTYTNPAQ